MALPAAYAARTGVYVGCVWQEYQLLLEQLAVASTVNILTGSGLNFTIGRISYTYGFQGIFLHGVHFWAWSSTRHVWGVQCWCTNNMWFYLGDGSYHKDAISRTNQCTSCSLYLLSILTCHSGIPSLHTPSDSSKLAKRL